MKVLEQLGQSLLSGEFLSVIVAGTAAFVWGQYSRNSENAKRKEAELARANFRLENAATTKEAIHEGLKEAKDLLIPTIQDLQRETRDLRRWLKSLDDRTDAALQLARALEKSQAGIFRYVDLALGSKGKGKSFLRSYFEENNDDDDSHDDRP